MAANWTTLIGPGVVAAVISAPVASIGIWISARTARQNQAERLKFDAKLARQKVRADRALKSWERKATFAEDVLAECYQLREMISRAVEVARGLADLTGPTDDAEGDRRRRIEQVCSSLREDLEPHSEAISGLSAKKYRAQAFFGEKTARAIEDLVGVYREIILSTSVLERSLTNDKLLKLRDASEVVIGLGPEKACPTINALGDAIQVIEETCRAATSIDSIADVDDDRNEGPF